MRVSIHHKNASLVVWSIMFALSFVLTSTQPAQSQIVFQDDFDDEALDTDWVTTFLSEGAGWTFEETGSDLVVTDVVDAGVATRNGEPWGVVRLSHSVPSLDDFSVGITLAWDSQSSVKAMQSVRLILTTADGIQIVSAGYEDAWVQSRGGRTTSISGNAIAPVANTLPLEGNAEIGITRQAGSVAVTWNGDTLLTGTSALPLEMVHLEFWHYAWRDVSFFGTESVGIVTITPEPGTISISALTLCGLALTRRTTSRVGCA